MAMKLDHIRFIYLTDQSTRASFINSQKWLEIY